MKILIVDDSRAMRMIVRRHLNEIGLGDSEFVEANNGAEALDVIAAQQPDLVLSDWNMPEMNGIELLEKLRERGDDVRFGFVTSENQEAYRDRAFDTGALFYIAKPFDADMFRKALGQYI